MESQKGESGILEPDVLGENLKDLLELGSLALQWYPLYVPGALHGNGSIHA